MTSACTAGCTGSDAFSASISACGGPKGTTETLKPLADSAANAGGDRTIRAARRKKRQAGWASM